MNSINIMLSNSERILKVLKVLEELWKSCRHLLQEQDTCIKILALPSPMSLAVYKGDEFLR